MDITTQAKPLEAQSTGVPVDHRDPNHPHFPGDVEAQPVRRPFMDKKAQRIAGGVVLIVLSLLASILVGGKIGMGMAKKPVVSPVQMTVSAEVETVYMTATAFSTSIVQFSITPNPTTITTTTMIPLPSFAPLPTSTPVPEATPTSEAPKEPTSTPRRGKGGGRQCSTVGNWPTQSECEKRCTTAELDLKEGRTAQCQVDPKAVYACVVCKA